MDAPLWEDCVAPVSVIRERKRKKYTDESRPREKERLNGLFHALLVYNLINLCNLG